VTADTPGDLIKLEGCQLSLKAFDHRAEGKLKVFSNFAHFSSLSHRLRMETTADR
jgi:hypothetical protein